MNVLEKKLLTPLAIELLEALGVNADGVSEVSIRMDTTGEPTVTIKRFIHDRPDTVTPVFERWRAVRVG